VFFDIDGLTPFVLENDCEVAQIIDPVEGFIFIKPPVLEYK